MKILFIILMIYSHEMCILVGNMVTMKEIPLSKGKVALVDDDMYDYLMQWKWHCDNGGYAVRNAYPEGKGKPITIRMHREITKAPKEMEVDHRDQIKLNNQASNLRLSSRSQNNINKPMHPRNTSGYKGVSFRKSFKKYVAQIQVNKVNRHIGYFNCPIDAAKAYNSAALAHFGEFAYLNQIPPNGQ